MKNKGLLILSRFNTLRDTTPQPTTWDAIVIENGSHKHEAATRHYREVCALLKELGFEQVHTRCDSFWMVVERSSDEVNHALPEIV